MSRIVSVWLPRWPILRFLAAQAINPADKQCVDPDRPFVLATNGSGGPRIAALNEAAEQAGLAVGESLSDARVKAGALQVRAVDAGADDAALRRLALWATRYTPTASPWNETNGADGFFLDIEGSAHLFGGEEKLIADLAARLSRFGLPARLAVAATPGTAWALSRFHRSPLFVLPCGQEAAALSGLPIEALRLSPETRTALRRLGFKSVGTLIDKPRAPFAARFAAELLRRLDQALGRVDEPLVPIIEPPVYHSLHYSFEPIVTQQAVVAPREPAHAKPRAPADARRCRRARLAALPLPHRWRSRDPRYRTDAADAQRLPCDASHRSKAGRDCGDRRCRLRLRGDRRRRHLRRTHARADRTILFAGREPGCGMATVRSVARVCSMHCANVSARTASAASRRSPVIFPSAPKRSRRSIRVLHARIRAHVLGLSHSKRARSCSCPMPNLPKKSWRLSPMVHPGAFAGAA